MAGGVARSVEVASEQSPERDEVRRANVGLLTSDLHGGCGPKLTHGLYRLTMRCSEPGMASRLQSLRPVAGSLSLGR
jgi:hypothetical protein